MVVDIAPQQQLNEVFTTKHSHHRSSSAHRQTSSTTNNTSASASSSSSTTNGTRIVTNELGKKAEQILGFATAFLDSPRETMLDFAHYPQRLNITASESNTPSRSATFSTVSPTAAHMPSTRGSSSSSVKTAASHDTSGKKRRVVTAAQLVPLIFKVVTTPALVKLPATISRRQSNARGTNNIMSSREQALVLHRESDVKLSDDENDDDEEDDDDEDNKGDDHGDSTNPVLMETIDNKIKNNYFNQINSNDNAPAPLSIPAPRRYENRIELEHSGRSSSRCQEDDSEDDDSDNHEAAHSDAENDDQTNSTNPNTLSLMDFISGKEPFSEPADSSLRHSPESLTAMKKRSISPEIKRDSIDPVHNADDHQNKRKKILIKRALFKCFISSVNTKIDIKRPSLPITIPTHLFFDRSPLAESTKDDDESLIERAQRTSKRYANGTLKHDTNADVPDGLSHLLPPPSSSLSNQTSSTPNGTHQKKNKTSHAQEKHALIKHEPPTLNSTSTKNESNPSCDINSSTEVDSKLRPTPVATTTTTVNPLIAIPPKKEKPTANVRPLQQTTTSDGLSTGNFINNSANTSDGLTTNGMRSNLPSTKMNYLKLKNMSKADLASLARKKKKQADYGKRTTLEEIREAMGLYLESVCYYIQCAFDEPKPDQRTELLITTLNMLQQLASNHQKMFCLSNRAGDLLSRIRQKFLLINYWLQSFIHQLQYNTNIPTIDLCASQVTDYFRSSTRTAMTNNQPQLTPMNDNNPISPLSAASQTSSSDVSTASATNQLEQHRYIYDFSKLMLNAYQSTNYWTKADRLIREKSLKEFSEQLMKQNQNRPLSRDDTTLDFLLYIFDAIELLRLSVA